MMQPPVYDSELRHSLRAVSGDAVLCPDPLGRSMCMLAVQHDTPTLQHDTTTLQQDTPTSQHDTMTPQHHSTPPMSLPCN